MNANKQQKSFLKRLFGHLKTVHNHRKEVRKNCFACGLYYQGLTHDLSKYSLQELIPSIKYYQGYRSPYAYEKQLYGYSLGWLHHKGKNKHHFEYWVDVKNHEWTPIDMPYRYLVESVCDRVAACKIYQKEDYRQESSLNYFLQGGAKELMSYNTGKEMERLLRLIADHGEEEAFKLIKQSLKKHKS